MTVFFDLSFPVSNILLKVCLSVVKSLLKVMILNYTVYYSSVIFFEMECYTRKCYDDEIIEDA
jgi:hypothetical protein